LYLPLSTLGSNYKIFAVGPTNSGSTFHTHGDAYFALAHGEKHFILYSFGSW
jgi:hypothetical protein